MILILLQTDLFHHQTFSVVLLSLQVNLRPQIVKLSCGNMGSASFNVSGGRVGSSILTLILLNRIEILPIYLLLKSALPDRDCLGWRWHFLNGVSFPRESESANKSFRFIVRIFPVQRMWIFNLIFQFIYECLRGWNLKPLFFWVLPLMFRILSPNWVRKSSSFADCFPLLWNLTLNAVVAVLLSMWSCFGDFFFRFVVCALIRRLFNECLRTCHKFGV